MKYCTVGQKVEFNSEGFGGEAVVTETRGSPGSRYKIRVLTPPNCHQEFWAHDFEIEGLEPVMTRDDVIRATAKHIRDVGHNMRQIADEITRRAIDHDASKFSAEEWPAFEKATPQLAQLVYGSEEYKAALRDLGPALKHHQRTNSHHPEFYADSVGGMTLIDMLEMLADWRAAQMRHEPPGNFDASFKVNVPRFNISPELEGILRRTVAGLGW